MRKSTISKLHLFTMLVFILSAMMLLSGCSVFTREEVTQRLPVAPRVIYSARELSDNVLYIKHTDENGTCYYAPYYTGDRTFSSSDGGPGSPNRVIFMHEDINAIPTMYKNDELVYRSNSSIWTGGVSFERFRDNGISLGFCNIYRGENGQYILDTSSNKYFSYYSDAYRLLNLGSNDTVVYSIGGATDIPASNFGSSGQLLNLEEGKQYQCILYVGTNQYRYNVSCDTRYLVSMEGDVVTDYTYIDNNLVRINIPEYFNSGYYDVGGFGLIRYINGTTYNEMTDLSIPNAYEENINVHQLFEIDDPNRDESDDEEPETFDGVSKYKFDVDLQKDVTIRVSYEVTDETLNTEEPYVVIIGDDFVRTVPKAENGNEFSGTFNLPVGRYTIEVSGMAGKECRVTVS